MPEPIFLISPKPNSFVSINAKGIKYDEYAIDGDQVSRDAMAARASGRRTLPQIFINDVGIGGVHRNYSFY